MKILTVELIEVFSIWLKDPTKITCELSIQDQRQLLNYHEKQVFYLKKLKSSDNANIVIQAEDLILGSQALDLEWIFGQNSNNGLDEWIKFEVASDAISVILKENYKDSLPKSLRIRIQGTVSSCKKQDWIEEKQKSLEKEEELEKSRLENSLSGACKDPADTETKIELIEPYSILLSANKAFLDEHIQSSPIADLPNVIEAENKIEDEDEDEQHPKSISEDISSEVPINEPPEIIPSQALTPPDPIINLPAIEVHTPLDLEYKATPTLILQDSSQEEVKLSENLPKKPPIFRQDFPIFPPPSYPTVSQCTYINTIGYSEFNLKNIQTILNKLRTELGVVFSKFVGESIQRESRALTRSPSRRSLGSGGFSPVSSQRSLNTSILSSFRVEEENILEVPGYIDVSIDKVSVQNVDCLALCGMGIIAKRGICHVQIDEISRIVEIIDTQSNATSNFNNSIKASQHEFLLEDKDFDMMILRLTEENARISKNIELKTKKNELLMHEKLKCEDDLRKLMEEKETILKSNSKSYIFDEIKQFSEAADKLDNLRIEYENKINTSTLEFKQCLGELSESQALLLQEKKLISTEIVSVSSEIKDIEKENILLKSDLQSTGSKSYVDEELQKMQELYIASSENHRNYLDSYRMQFLNLRSKKEDEASESETILRKIEYDTKGIKNSQVNWSKAIESYSSALQDLTQKFKTVSKENCYIEDVCSKKQDIEKLYASVHRKFINNQDAKENLINEITYFSDFIFSLTQSFMQQKRIRSQLTGIIAEKDMELEALRHAVNLIKLEHPVYIPLENDYIDEALGQYLNSRDIPLLIPFVRESYGVYFYGSKKVTISLERGKIIVKSGGGFMPIASFIDNYTESEIDKFEKHGAFSPRAKSYVEKVTKEGNLLDENILKAKKIMERAETPIIEEDI